MRWDSNCIVWRGTSITVFRDKVSYILHWPSTYCKAEAAFKLWSSSLHLPTVGLQDYSYRILVVHSQGWFTRCWGFNSRVTPFAESVRESIPQIKSQFGDETKIWLPWKTVNFERTDLSCLCASLPFLGMLRFKLRTKIRSKNLVCSCEQQLRMRQEGSVYP